MALLRGEFCVVWIIRERRRLRRASRSECPARTAASGYNGDEMERDVFDLIVVGGGIVGLATAYQAGRAFPRWRIGVLEKEADVALHQSGRNSGVLHSGLYYAPGSLKASLCRAGRAAMIALCADATIPCRLVGKVVVATDEAERVRLTGLHARACANGVACALVDGEALRAIEPHAAGLAALHVPDAGVVDYRAVARELVRRVRAGGGVVATGARVRSIRAVGGSASVRTAEGEWRAARVAVVAGLHADRVARACGIEPGARIVPFRGEYFELVGASASRVRALVYPVSDPTLPFLGVHLTRGVDDRVECGPNAVLALAREGYDWGRVDARDLAELVVWPGTWRLARRHWRTGVAEVARSLLRARFARSLQRLVPSLDPRDLVRVPAGVRAQAVRADGALVDDFLVVRAGRVVAVVNAPSPAATASLAIGEHVVERLASAS